MLQALPRNDILPVIENHSIDEVTGADSSRRQRTLHDPTMPHQLQLFVDRGSSSDRDHEAGVGEADRDCEIPPVDRTPARQLETDLRRQLDGRLAGRLGRLTLTDNRSTLITARPRPDGFDVRLHWSFVYAETETLDALIELAQGPRRGPRFRSALATVRSHAAPFLQSERRPPPDLHVTAPPRQTIVKQGVAHNLAALFESLNTRYFDGEIEASITWGGPSTAGRGRNSGRSRRGRRRRRPRRRSIRLGSYLASQRLIRIHPVLDDPSVPEFVVASVVHHEMAHAVAPPRPSRAGATGRRHVHTPEFRQQERRFEHFDEAQRWITDNLEELFKRRR